MYVLDRAGVLLDFIRVEYQNDLAALDRLKAAQPVDQLLAGEVKALLCERSQLVPREDDIVSVD